MLLTGYALLALAGLTLLAWVIVVMAWVLRKVINR